MDADWDLQAVVRGCCSTVSSSTTTTTTTTPTCLADAYNQQDSNLYGEGFFPDLFQQKNDNSIEQLLNNLYNPIHFPALKKPPPISPLPVLGDLPFYHHHQPPPQRKQVQGKQQSLGISRCTTSHTQSTTKFKKRKPQIKNVSHVPAEGSSSSDFWSWRKYGQKPIKGSPYPRGYYKCSTLKGCLARKQVERNRSDPSMLIITYTGEHNHPVPTQRSSLAGSSRNKPTTSNSTSTSTSTSTSSDEDNRNKPTSSPPVSPTTEKMDENERDDTDDDNCFEISGVVIDDDIFDGLDEIVGSPSDHLAKSKSSPPFPWLLNNVATTTTAGS